MKKTFKRFFLWAARVLVGMFLLSILLVIFYRSIPVFFTPLMGIRMVEQVMDEERPFRWKKNWVSLDEISESMVLAVMASEDQKFTIHNGFDWNAIQKAMEGNKAGKNLKGGSTISNQTAKNVFLWPGRNMVRKLFEAYFTVLIEFFWTKERIMEVYLNVIEMGDGIYGIEAAAQSYYNKSAASLSPHEAAMVAAILPSPLRWQPTRPTSYLRNRQNWILRNMNNLGAVNWDIENK